jgi:hypothetical protein
MLAAPTTAYLSAGPPRSRCASPQTALLHTLGVEPPTLLRLASSKASDAKGRAARYVTGPARPALRCMGLRVKKYLR